MNHEFGVHESSTPNCKKIHYHRYETDYQDDRSELANRISGA